MNCQAPLPTDDDGLEPSSPLWFATAVALLYVLSAATMVGLIAWCLG